MKSYERKCPYCKEKVVPHETEKGIEVFPSKEPSKVKAKNKAKIDELKKEIKQLKAEYELQQRVKKRMSEKLRNVREIVGRRYQF